MNNLKKIVMEHKWSALISSLIILLPMVVGLILWNDLSNMVPIHWGADGTADSFGHKGIIVFGLPLLLLATHWLCIGFTAADPKNKNQTKKAIELTFWILPFCSTMISIIFYTILRNGEFMPNFFVACIIGLLFIVIGNYLPKMKQNTTLGIKTLWAILNEENWNATHRFGGKVWTIGGIAILLSMLLPQTASVLIVIASIIILALTPILYSYLYYKKQRREGTCADIKTLTTKTHRVGMRIGIVAVSAILVFVCVIMFTGEIRIHTDTETLSVEATYFTDLEGIRFADIDSIEFRENDNVGLRTNGFASAKLQLGTYQNEEFGTYTRYTYTSSDACIVLRDGDKVLVLSAKNASDTKLLYTELSGKMKG